MDDYASRLHLALEYIRTHLDQDIHLAQLADVAHFSPSHFHRVFAAAMNETPNNYVRRMRIEAAAQHLMMFPPRPMSQIALECGFKSQALLARAFRAHFGMSASQWRKGESWQFDGQYWHLCPPTDRTMPSMCTPEIQAARQGRRPTSITELRIRQLPAQRWAYFWCNGADQAQLRTIWSRVTRWARMQWGDSVRLQGASRWSDDPSITPLHLCRYEAGLLIADNDQVGRQLAVRNLPAGQYLVMDFCGTWQEEAAAAEYLFNYWLPRSNWALDERPHYCLSDPFATESGLIQWCVPVRKSRAGPRRLYQLADFKSASISN